MAARMAALERQLARMNVQKPKPGPSKPKGKKKTGKSAISGSISRSGEVEILKTELLGTIKVDPSKSTASGNFKLQVAAIPYLKKLGSCFERVKWQSLRVMYKPATSMTQAGLVSIGMDWNWSNAQVAREKIACYSPTMTNAVWKENSFTAPQKMLQSRTWYSTVEDDSVDAGPGIIAWAIDASAGATGLTAGEVWITYKVVLAGTVA